MRKFVIDKVFVLSGAWKTVSCFEIETDDLLVIIGLSFFSTFDEWMDLENGESPLLEDSWLPEIQTKKEKRGDPENLSLGIFSQQYLEN